MIIPIRCFTCGKLIADKWEEFSERIRSGENAEEMKCILLMPDDFIRFRLVDNWNKIKNRASFIALINLNPFYS